MRRTADRQFRRSRTWCGGATAAGFRAAAVILPAAAVTAALLAGQSPRPFGDLLATAGR